MCARVVIEYKRGYAINKRAQAIINSANGFLLLGTSGAGAIRQKSQRLTKKEKAEFDRLLRSLPIKIRNDYRRVMKERRWPATYAQLGCLKLLKERNSFEGSDVNVFNNKAAIIPDKAMFKCAAIDNE